MNTATAAESRFRDPSSIFFQYNSIRRWIIASYWIIIALAVPLWWKTTSIERLALPTSEVYTQAQKKLKIPLEICVDSVFSKQVEAVGASIQNAAEYLQVDVNVGRDCNQFTGYAVLPGDQLAIHDRKLYYPANQAEGLASTLVSLVAPEMDHRATQYSPRYRLSFTLLNEDSSAGQVISGWDIRQAISQYVSPITSALGILHNFTIESQVQFHAPLAFEPTSLDDGTYGLTQEDLTVFINSAEWTLSSSSSNDPVLHFVLFVPSAQRRPLAILNADGTPSTSNAFLIPQWGGIVILNLPAPPPTTMHLALPDLRTSFPAFSRQLLTLLGFPRLPPSVSISSATSNSSSSKTKSTLLSSWQIDSLLRQRTHENVVRSHDTLRSTVTVVSQIQGMPVGAQVQSQVQGALKALTGLFRSNLSLDESLVHSSRALTLSSNAFFHPGMLALLYFPAEHKYAVYTPLFASAMIPLLVAALREVGAWRKERREKEGARKEIEEKADGTDT